jgi:hypothetical protein
MIDWEKKIGVLWMRTDKKGQEYYSGEIEFSKEEDVTIPKGTKIKLMVWNNKKAKPTHPDWNIFVIDDDEDARPVKKAEPDGNTAEEDDIPF